MVNQKTFRATDPEVQEKFLDAFEQVKDKGPEKGSKICALTGLSAKQAREVYYELMISGRATPMKIEFSSLDELSVNDNGGFNISAGRIRSLGLTESFPINARLTASANGDKIVIESIKEDGKVQLVAEKKKRKTKAQAETSNNADGSAQAESDAEPAGSATGRSNSDDERK